MSDVKCEHTQIAEDHGPHGHACYACDEELPNPDECWECTADNAIAALVELRAQLAAAEKERDEVFALAARVAQLEAALEPTVATHAVIAGFLGGAHHMWTATQILTAIRARAGMEPR